MTRLSTHRTDAALRTICICTLLTVAALMYTRCDVGPARAQDSGVSRGLTNADHDTLDAGQPPLKGLSPAPVTRRLAFACYAEASGSEADCAAVWSVVQRRAARAHVTDDAMLSKYTSVDRCTRVPTDKEWARHLDIARRVLSGEIRNSCPGADQFGGLAISRDAHNARKMVHAGKWRLIVCSAAVKNSYFREVGRQ